MLKIGEFSKLSHLTIKTLRFYENEGLLIPAFIDEWTGYRYYETEQLTQAAMIKSYRQLDLSIEDIKAVLSGEDVHVILGKKAAALRTKMEAMTHRLSVINQLLEEEIMKYNVVVKEIPECIVYYSEVRLNKHSDMMQVIPSLGQECMALNPGLKCSDPSYEFCEYLDNEHRDTDVLIRHNEAVTAFGKENNRIRFKKLPTVKVLSLYHQGAYDRIGEAYAYLMNYAKANGYEAAGLARESYIDGIWNKNREEDWLTEIQLPIR